MTMTQDVSVLAAKSKAAELAHFHAASAEKATREKEAELKRRWEDAHTTATNLAQAYRDSTAATALAEAATGQALKAWNGAKGELAGAMADFGIDASIAGGKK